MIITRQMLRRDLPPIIDFPDGSCNCVLACYKRTIYDDSNTYLPRWGISNTHYYCKNVGIFEGWIELEDLVSSYMPDDVLEVEDEIEVRDNQ